MIFQLTKKSKEDLKEIARYTEISWGREQRNNYLRMVDEAFKKITNGLYKGQNCDEISKGYFRYNLGKHSIFYYYKNSTTIIISRILHSKMNIPSYF